MACSRQLPPSGLLEIVFSFDTTGSMSSILDEVRGRLQDMIQRLQSDIPGIRIGVIAHGDYCDKDVFYLTKQLNLCQNVAELCQFVQDIEGTGGGDEDECYELVLRLARVDFAWSCFSQKILVMIGDANPHEPEYEMNTDNIDWREELKLMKEKGIKVYGVQVFENAGADGFFRSLATETDGHYLKLTEFSNICDLMMAICYAERGENFLLNYENEVRSRFEGATSNVDQQLPKDLEGVFGTLRRDDSTKSMTSITCTAPEPALTHPQPLLASTAPKIAKVLPVIKQNTKTKPVKRLATKVKPVVKRKQTAQKPGFRTNKRKQNQTSKEFREAVSTSDYDSQCGCKKSTKWHLVYSPENPDDKGWRCRRLRSDGKCYWKRQTAFPKLSNDKGIYEIAVQTGLRRKLHAVYNCVVKTKHSALMQTAKWETALFRNSRTMAKIRTAAAKQGCRIFLRRMQYSNKTISKMAEFDYAWRHNHTRPVVKNGLYISGEPEEMETS